MGNGSAASVITDKDDKNESLLIHDIARLQKTLFDRQVRGLGLTRAQWQTIATLRRHPGISQAELAHSLDVEPMTVARTIDRLEKAGWIRRQQHAADRRVNRLYLTDRAREVAARMRALALALRREGLLGMKAREHQELVRLLRAMRENLGKRDKARQ